MLRKIVRSYYKLRYMPRNLFVTLAGIMGEVVVIRRHLVELGRPDRALGTETEIASFCDDATRLLMDLSTKLAASTARAEGLERALSRSGERLSRMEGALSGLHAAVSSLDAAGGQMRSELHALVEAEGRGRHVQLARLDHLVRMADQQALLSPASSWGPEASARVQRILAALNPVSVVGVAKLRVGRDHDGGYVMLDDFRGIGCAVSAGIADDVSWDIDLADRAIQVLQFDPTVAGPPVAHANFSFEPLRLAAADQPDALSLEGALSRSAQGGGDALLKMDIEGSEWDVLDAASEDTLSRCRQIVCEFHDLDRLCEPSFGDRAERVFGKLSRTHFVHHVHGNNCASFANVANVAIPQTLEVSFALRSAYQVAATQDVFPTELDRPNQPGRADLYLGRFQFGQVA